MTGTRTPHLQHIVAERKAMKTPTPIPAKDMVKFKHKKCSSCGYRHPAGFQSCRSCGTSSLWYSHQYKAKLAGIKEDPSYLVPHQSNHWTTEETAHFRPRFLGAFEMLP